MFWITQITILCNLFYTPILLSAIVRRNIYLSTKEAIHNILKHSKATKVYFDVKMSALELFISIRDNGIGISRGLNNPSGQGLRNIKNRIERIGGTSIITNENGTKISLIIPLEYEEG